MEKEEITKKEYLTPTEFAMLAGISPPTVYAR